MTDNDQKLFERMFKEKESELKVTDPEYFEIITDFAFDEVTKQSNIDEKTRMIIILSALMGCQGIDIFKKILDGALNLQTDPIKIREAVYQGTAYLGIGRAYPFVLAMNNVFKSHCIDISLKSQKTVNKDTRLKSGNEKQIQYFGEGIRESWKKGDKQTQHINKWLADNCFGDYYTRTGLSDREREMVTFCFIMAQGGCEMQLTAHARANMNLGNDKKFLIDVVSQCVPYVGYPRSLNAISCIQKAEEAMNNEK